jgi:hypothetical protein
MCPINVCIQLTVPVAHHGVSRLASLVQAINICQQLTEKWLIVKSSMASQI